MKKSKNEIQDLSNNYTIITGACGGLGRAFVLECAKAGENLILTGTSEVKLLSLTKEFSEALSKIKVLTYVLDLGEKTQRETFVKFLKNQNVTATKLINNAGVIIEGDMEKFSDEEISKAVEVNCIGTLDLTKKLLRERDKSQKFKVVTVSSVASCYPIPHMAVYSATKAFLTSMMTALSVEFKGQNVNFSTVCPGGMATNEAMKQSIKSMGLGGKLSATKTQKVAKIALRAVDRNKKIVTPGFFNKVLVLASKVASRPFLARVSGRIYGESQKKRKI